MASMANESNRFTVSSPLPDQLRVSQGIVWSEREAAHACYIVHAPMGDGFGPLLNMDEPEEAIENPKPSIDLDTQMSQQDRYIDARLAGIESTLDARMEAMQRFQEQAESRFERATQQLHTDFKEARTELAKESEATRRHSTHVAIGTVAGVLAAVGLGMAVAVSWIGDQSAWLRDSVNRIEQRIEAPSVGPPTSVSPTQQQPAEPEQQTSPSE
jgi:hypothetical protein